ncbi:hypothetical protein [Polaromonas sp.]|uniref:hypothetical protein n=1 Tax=Polaromonas sp. TaxID=1869339 RepID=UPI003C8EEAE5
MIRLSVTYLAGLVAGSVLVAAYEALAYWRDVESTSAVAAVWPGVFLLLLVLWIIEDSKAFPAIQKPFEYGFLVFMLALPYLPYYLWRTRRAYGLLMLAGFVALYCLGYLAQLAIYAAS